MKHNIEIINTLNDLYRPMLEKSREIKNKLKSSGFSVKKGFYNNHSIKNNNMLVTEYYPIPVLLISEKISIGIDIDYLWLEIKLAKEKAVLLDFYELSKKYEIEVYGAEEYTADFYDIQSNPIITAAKIAESKESEICIQFNFELNTETEKLITIINSFII